MRKGFGTVRAEVRAYGAIFNVRFAIALFSLLLNAYVLKICNFQTFSAYLLSIIEFIDLPAIISRSAAAAAGRAI